MRQAKVDYKIEYGRADQIAGLLKDISARKGIGDILSKGIVNASKEWGMADQAIHVKGLEPAGYDPRILKGMGLAYGTSPRGACHLRSTFYKPELSKMIDPDTIDGKAEMFIEWEELSQIIKGITGLDLDKESMRKIAAGISNDTRRFNLREGLGPEDDLLPRRFHKEALPETNKVITEEAMKQLLNEYYKARGWDGNGLLAEK